MSQAKPLALIKRHRPTPGVGHYENASELYIKMTQTRTKGLTSLSMDKMPKLGYQPRQMYPDPCGDSLNEFVARSDYFRWSNAGKGENAHNFAQVVDRDKISFLKEQHQM